MLAIGLTGGIGCGKSAVSDLFQSRGVPVIDADRVAREVVQPGEPALQQISERFGQQLLQPDGQLDRRQLRSLIFADPAARSDLEAILHPAIRRSMRDSLAQLTTPYAILSIPLLLETGQRNDFDRILVVDCPAEIQRQRVLARDQIGREQLEAILASQCSRSERLAAADDVVDNSGAIEALLPQVEQLHHYYLGMAAGR